jgi:hypothetical protein
VTLQEITSLSEPYGARNLRLTPRNLRGNVNQEQILVSENASASYHSREPRVVLTGNTSRAFTPRSILVTQPFHCNWNLLPTETRKQTIEIQAVLLVVCFSALTNI